MIAPPATQSPVRELGSRERAAPRAHPGRRRACCAVPALLALALCSSAARADRPGLDHQVDEAVAGPGDPVRLGVWFGTPSSAPIYQRDADRAMPAASVVKTAILVELFAAHAGHLDEPLGAAADAVLGDDRHPGMSPFSAAQRGEIRTALRGATARTIGAIMMARKPASNAVYNAAANLAIASLGGPAEVTSKIRARDAAFAGVVVRRYMLAPRTAGGDNDATPAALAAVLAAVASGKLPGGVDAATADDIAQAMMQTTDAALGVHRHKEGNLDSDPMVCVKTGFYARGNGKPPLVYVVGAMLPARPSGSRDAAHRRLDKLTDAVRALLRAEASR
ncbi:MAG TPA: serine hydrolase [Kofleriaceae bacterium]|nr:serine hydrolase [Kofleriaceae bacterium]